MYVPKINTTEGVKPITWLPNSALLEAYLGSNISAEDKEVGRLLQAGVDDPELAGYILRMALDGLFNLVSVYPGAGMKEPAGARFVCAIPDGSLYLVRVPLGS